MFISLDFGAGNFKRVSDDGEIIIPSCVSVVTGETMGKVTGLRTKTPPKKVEINGYRYFVGENSHDWGRPVENLSDERFVAGSPELRALVYAALSGCNDIEPASVIVGLPQSALGDNIVKDTVAGLKSWLSGEHTWLHDDQEHSININKVTVTSQAAGALFDYLLSDDTSTFRPERKAHFKQELGIISIGMNTLEFLVVQNGRVVNRFVHSVTAGVRRLLELADPSHLYSRGELDAMLRTNSLDTKNILPVWGSEVIGHIERAWGKSYRRFANVIVVGGGALLLQGELIKALNGKTYIPVEPVLSVARGLYKLAAMKGS